jgi:hypothetical protein
MAPLLARQVPRHEKLKTIARGGVPGEISDILEIAHPTIFTTAHMTAVTQILARVDSGDPHGRRAAFSAGL